MNAGPYRAIAIRRLSDEHVATLRKLVAERGSIKAIATRLRVAENTVRDVMSGATFRKTTAERVEKAIDDLAGRGERAA